MAAEPVPHLTSLLHASNATLREEAWAALVRDYNSVLLHAARSLGGDHDIVMDRYALILESLRQDDFRRLRAYAADGRTKLSTWLIVIATRICLDDYRHRYGRTRPAANGQRSDARERRKALADLAGASGVDPADIADEISSDPEEQLETGELSAALRSALATLEPRDRLLLRLRFEEGLSVPRIAGTMGFPSPFHAYRRLTALFADLKDRLRGQGIEDSAG